MTEQEQAQAILEIASFSGVKPVDLLAALLHNNSLHISSVFATLEGLAIRRGVRFSIPSGVEDPRRNG